MVVIIEPYGAYPDKSFKAIATKAWNEFFANTTDFVNVAHWMIVADAGSIRLSARRSSVDESDPDWVGYEPIGLCAEGVLELLDCEPNLVVQDEIRTAFRAWVEKGILESFQSARVRKKFEKFNPEAKGFAIVTSTTDCGLAEDKLSLLYRNSTKVTLAKIRTQQSSAAKKRKAGRKRRGQVLKKKKEGTRKGK